MAENSSLEVVEQWRTVDCAPDYEVSNQGRIRKGLLIMQLDGSSDYWRVRLRHNGVRTAYCVHSLMAKAFLPNPENKPTVNHIDGDKRNNSLANFEWATYREQMLHAIALGLAPDIGKRRRKLSDEQVVEIKRLRAIGKSTPRLAALFGVAQGTIWKALNGWTKYAMD